MNKEKLYSVWHPNHGEVHVTAADRYWAIVEAAKEWGLRWTTIAKDCEVRELGKAPVNRTGKEKTGRGTADKKKQRHR